MPSVLVIGIDPQVVPEMDGATLRACFEQVLARFGDHGIAASMVLVRFDDSDEPAMVKALSGRDWDVVVIGAGIRKSESVVLLFEQIVNLVMQHAPQAAIAFNASGADSVEAARRWLYPRPAR
ncbi:MAG TPA: hypothetical protein VFQ44_02735 [Streptosporangiaceae bacterium]|nr:hypothetical protein [Streptosporangiaceae bacterium]